MYISMYCNRCYAMTVTRTVIKWNHRTVRYDTEKEHDTQWCIHNCAIVTYIYKIICTWFIGYCTSNWIQYLLLWRHCLCWCCRFLGLTMKHKTGYLMKNWFLRNLFNLKRHQNEVRSSRFRPRFQNTGMPETAYCRFSELRGCNICL